MRVTTAEEAEAKASASALGVSVSGLIRSLLRQASSAPVPAKRGKLTQDEVYALISYFRERGMDVETHAPATGVSPSAIDAAMGGQEVPGFALDRIRAFLSSLSPTTDVTPTTDVSPPL